MSTLPTCKVCKRTFHPEHGDFDPKTNEGICDDCHMIRKRIVLVIEDPAAVETTTAELSRAGRVHTCHRKAALKNNRRQQQQPRRKPTPEEIEEERRLAGTRRDRRDFTSRLELAEASFGD